MLWVSSGNSIGLISWPSKVKLGVKYSPVPELSFHIRFVLMLVLHFAKSRDVTSLLKWVYRGWTRAGEKRVQDNLHAHAQNEPIKSPYLLASTCREILFSARALKKDFLWCWYCGKKKIDKCFIVVCTLIDNDYASIIFSQTFFRVLSAFWASLQKVLKGKSDAYK